ncbi:TasA family protein [Rossellomorea oryzaecorticis]|uniref:TasA family protein n=1 Tax=Rossellomorea oryzaecorticis TaxID=1396505 RepID=A0ABU9K5I5_9BACI
MSIKKKMGLGIMAGALGVSLIGGGTWAAFNDVEETSNTFAAGTLDLVVGEATTMDFVVKNLKPGDYFTKELVLSNNGSLDINQINVHATMEEGPNKWEDKDELDLASKFPGVDTTNSQEDFLSQFKITITPQGETESVYDGTLEELVSGTGVGELTDSTDQEIGLAAGPNSQKTYEVKVEFVEDSTPFSGSRLHQQNKFQGESSNLKFVFEATQMPGQDRSNNISE